MTKASKIIETHCCGQLLPISIPKHVVVGKVKELEAQIANQKRKLEDKIRLTKFVDTANSQLSTENKGLVSQVVFLEHRLNKAIAALQRRGSR